MYRVAAFFCGLSFSDKQDDDACIRKVQRWQNAYPPSHIAALEIGERIKRIKAMVSELSLFDVFMVEDSVQQHLKEVVRASGPDARSRLVQELRYARLDESLIDRLQLAVLQSCRF